MRKFPFYLLLFGLYPVLALWAENIQEVGFDQVGRVVVASLVVCFLVWLLIWLVFRDVERASLIAVVALIIFFSYGHLYESVRTWSFEWSRHRYLLPLLVILFSGWVLFVIKRKQVNQLTAFFNVFSLVLLLMPLYTIANFEIRSYQSHRKQAAAVITQGASPKRPDIYYIILDGHGRQDVLDKYYHYDDSVFIEHLKQKGFYVAKDSTSNYRKTLLSLTSSLNMTYIQDLLPDLDPKSKDYTGLMEQLRHSAVRKLLAENGYRFVAVSNGIKTTIADAEVVINPDPASLSERVDLAGEGSSIDLNSFEGLFLETSLARLWVDWQVKQGKSNVFNVVAVEAPYNHHRKFILFDIHSIATTADLDGNNFVFIHVVAPHPPFVFGAHGEQVKHNRLFSIADGPYSQGSKEDYVRQYADQAKFIDEQVLAVIDDLLERSDPKPIIIIQGDHGPKGFSDEDAEIGNFTENFGILNAYYFPDQDYTGLYPSISPVNSFRVVLNKFIGTDFPMLDDESYFSDVGAPFDFIKVTEQVK